MNRYNYRWYAPGNKRNVFRYAYLGTRRTIRKTRINTVEEKVDFRPVL